VNARVLETPTIHYRERPFTPELGAWNLRNKMVETGTILGSWSVLAFVSEKELPDKKIEDFVRKLVNTCHNTGMVS